MKAKSGDFNSAASSVRAAATALTIRRASDNVTALYTSSYYDVDKGFVTEIGTLFASETGIAERDVFEVFRHDVLTFSGRTAIKLFKC